MRKVIAIALLVVMIMTSCYSVALLESGNTPQEKLEFGISMLEKYLVNGGVAELIALEDVISQFRSIGAYGMANGFLTYATVLQCVENENFDQAEMWKSALQFNAKFIEYLQEESFVNQYPGIMNVEALLEYCQARKLESEGNSHEAMNIYAKYINFYDALNRWIAVSTQLSVEPVVTSTPTAVPTATPTPSTEDIQCAYNWADYQITLEDWTLTPAILNQPLKNCSGFTYALRLGNIQSGSPYGEWTLYGQTNDNSWVWLESFTASSDITIVDITLSAPMDIYALCAVRKIHTECSHTYAYEISKPRYGDGQADGYYHYQIFRYYCTEHQQYRIGVNGNMVGMMRRNSSNEENDLAIQTLRNFIVAGDEWQNRLREYDTYHEAVNALLPILNSGDCHWIREWHYVTNDAPLQKQTADVEDVEFGNLFTWQGAQWQGKCIKTPNQVTPSTYLNQAVVYHVHMNDPIENISGVYSLAPQCAPDMRLDAEGGSTEAGTNIQIYENNSTDAQKFRFEELNNGYYEIISEISGMALNVTDGFASCGVNVDLYYRNGSDAQQWSISDAGDGFYYIVPKLNSDFVLDVSNGGTQNWTNVQIWENHGTNAQKWMLIE